MIRVLRPVFLRKNTKYKLLIYKKYNEKTKRKYERKPPPYQDMVRTENLDAYESLIKYNLVDKKINKSIE